MVGNVIPAIANTTVTLASLAVVRAFYVLLGHWEQCTSAYVSLHFNSLEIYVPDNSK